MNRRSSMLYGYAFALPAVLFILVFMAWPIFESLRMSFFKWDGLTPAEFIGLDNYTKLLLDDPVFALAVRNTFLFSLLSVLGIVGMGFFLALAVERRVPGWKTFKVVWFLPVMLSQTVVSILWVKFFDPTQGIVNSLLRTIGLGSLTAEWLSDPSVVMYSVAFVSVWQYSGYAMLLLLAAMEGIAPEIHDAATIDGVGGIRRIVSIIFPIIKSVFSVVVMLITMGSLKTFDTIYVLTGGGPGDASIVLSLHLYKNAFKYYSFGYASAVSTIMFIILFCASFLYQNLLKHEELY